MKKNSNFKILIVDDEKEYRKILKMILEENEYVAETACSGKDALEILKRNYFNLVLSDLVMEEMSGTELLEQIKEQYPETEVIIVTGYGTIQNAVETIKKGAFTYFIKSHDLEELLIEVAKVKKLTYLENDNEVLRNQQINSKFMLNTKSNKFRKVLDIAEKAAKSNVNILILGESGVGKEVFANHIHQCSDRKDRCFIAVNCHSLPENLLESELFGHEKGAFTGATDRRKGRFEAAHGGTLFLDEVGEISMSTQVKLLRALELKSIERIGSNKSIDVDFRLICATNKDLYKSIDQGDFRDDLFYRISTITIEIPPLRDRREDIPELIDFFFEISSIKLKKKVEKIEKGTIDFLMSYNYPGNIRELKNIIERLVVLSADGIIKKADLPDYKESIRFGDEIIEIKPLKKVRREFEARYIGEVLELSGYNISEAARKLEMSRRQLFNKITEYHIK